MAAGPDQTRDFADFNATRVSLFDQAKEAAAQSEPLKYGNYTLKLADVDYHPDDVDEEKAPERWDYGAQSDAIYKRQTLGRRLQGTWELADADGNLIQKKRHTLAVIPRINEDGTMIYRGSRYNVMNQHRMKAGVYVRKKKSGEVESHANIKPGHGPSHRYVLNPETGVFYVEKQHAKIPLVPLLESLGVRREQLEEAWGPELTKVNYAKKDSAALQKLYDRFVPKHLKIEHASDENKRALLGMAFQDMLVDPWVVSKTLGMERDKIDGDVILAATKKVLSVARGETDPDDRDHLAFKTYHSAEDLVAERIAKDHSRVRRELLRRIARKGDLKAIGTKPLQRYVEAALFDSGLAVQPEYPNPLDPLDKATRLTPMGEGGLGSLDAIPAEARDVHESHQGFVDPSRTTESLKVGVDVTFAGKTRKGRDGKIYSPFVDVRSGEQVYQTPEDAMDKTVAFTMREHVPGHVIAVRKGKMDLVKKDEVDLVLPSPTDSLFSLGGHVTPFRSATIPHRTAMGARMAAQALPLVNSEAPLVQTATSDDPNDSYINRLGQLAGAIRAEQPGVVKSVDTRSMVVQYADGSTRRYPLHDMTPTGSKTYMRHYPTVKPGDQVQPNQLLARTNYTDNEGQLAIGLNAKVALMPADDNFEDALRISESFAKRLTSQHLYRKRVEPGPEDKVERNAFISIFPGKYSAEQLKKVDKSGLIQVGQKVQYGDPLVLHVSPKNPTGGSRVHRKQKIGYSDKSLTWDHDTEGIVVRADKLDNGEVALGIATVAPTVEGDKISGMFGDKGVVKVVPDEQMIKDENGEPVDILASDLGLISRGNVGRILEMLLGKVAHKTGKRYRIQDFDDTQEAWEYVQREMKNAGVTGYETVVDPNTDRKIPNVLVGRQFIMKLHHLTDAKAQARGIGRYGSDDTPAKGSGEGGQAKRLSNQELNALIAHGTSAFIREGAVVKGQRNDDYWMAYMNGVDPPKPKVPMVYDKYMAYMKGLGLNPVRQGTKTKLMAMTDRNVMELAAGRNVRTGDLIDERRDGKPVPGGLFDPELFGEDGSRWARYELKEAMPHPLMEEPIRRLMGVTKNQFRDVLSGKTPLGKFGSGPEAIGKYLKSLDLDQAIGQMRTQMKSGSKATRDLAIRRLGYLKTMKDRDITPDQLMIKQVPILPPKFRPVSKLADGGAPLIDGMNLLYRDLIETDKNYGKVRTMTNNLSDERLALYDSLGAVIGMKDPVDPELKQKQVRGIFQRIVGPSGPKYGMMQRKLLSGTVDFVSRGVMAPSSSLTMDEIGLPENQAWDMYRVQSIRLMRRAGMPLVQAMEQWTKRTPLARKALIEAMETHPVVTSRAPVLHKYGIIALKPKLVPGSTILSNVFIPNPMAGDFDGDQVNIHAVMTPEAAKEMMEKALPSKMLLSIKDFKSPVYVPTQDFALGLYKASTEKSDSAPKVFVTKQDAVKAFMRGEINVNDRVQILQKG